MSPTDGRHPPAPPPRYSCHQAEVCCTARIARAAWCTDGARRFISRGSERDDSAARTCLAGCKVRPLPAMTVGSSGVRGPKGAPDSGDDASLRGGAPPCTAGTIKDGSRSCPESRVVVILIFFAWLWIGLCVHLLPRLLLHTLVAFFTHPPDFGDFSPPSPPTRLTPPAAGTPPTRSRLRLLHPLAAGSTESPSLTPDRRAPSLDRRRCSAAL